MEDIKMVSGACVVQVIAVKVIIGKGTPEDLMRERIVLYTLQGEKLAEIEDRQVTF